MALSRAALARAAKRSASAARLPPRSGMPRITAAEARPMMTSTTISSTSVKPPASSRALPGAPPILPVPHPLVTFPRSRIERFARLGEHYMSSRKSTAILAVAGLVLAALLLFLLLHPGRTPDPQPGNDFDPAD